jgi:sugar phosphate isomerase/epimerase
MKEGIMAGMVKGPAIFLAQFAGDAAPFNSFDAICAWAASLGYKGVQIPTWDDRLFDLAKAAVEGLLRRLKGIAASHGLAITELSSHLQGQLVAVNPAYDEAFDAFAPKEVHGKPGRAAEMGGRATDDGGQGVAEPGLKAHATFSGALAWPYVYPWPQRAQGLIETAFEELAKRWKPILDAFDDAGVDVCYELHPGEDLFDGTTFERFLDAVKGHKRCAINYDPSHFVLQQLDYLEFIDIYHERIKAFHVKDAEFNPTGRQGVYSGYASWIERAGRFRSLGDGQVDFGGIFSKMAQYGYSSWAVLEWECALKHPEDGAREGAEFIKRHIIRTTEKAFDDYAGGAVDKKQIKRALGLG